MNASNISVAFLSGVYLLIHSPIAAAGSEDFIDTSGGIVVAMPDSVSSQTSDDLNDVSVIGSQSIEQKLPSADSLAGYDLAQLSTDPKLFKKTINQAVISKDWDKVDALLKVYKTRTDADKDTLRQAQASLEQSRGNNKPLILLYQDQLSEHPNDINTRLKLAKLLQSSRQYKEAKSELSKLQADKLSPAMKSQVERLLGNIDKIEQWRFNVTASYLRDVNINNVPDEEVQTKFNRVLERESGNGISLVASANKRMNLPKGYFAAVGSNLSLKGYWDASDYNDYSLTVSGALGYSNPSVDWSITPYIKRRMYDESPYSVKQGVTLKASKWLLPKIKMTISGAVGNETFDNDLENKREVDSKSYGVSTYYKQSSQQSFTLGWAVGHTKVPKTLISSSDSQAISVSWNQQWPNKISTTANIGYSTKQYASPIEYYSDNQAALLRYYKLGGGEYGSSREDKTTSLRLQLWKSDLTFYGFTPRVVLKYAKTNSNFDYYDDRDEKSATMVLSKSF